ncbi:hypothetical protein AwDysgo_21110 [Bacteroidales bacterium]|nr:hypothetical protein AwDysgo_21110 [Bacteroidales bacterium]
MPYDRLNKLDKHSDIAIVESILWVINYMTKKILETYIAEKEFIQYICRKKDAFNRCSYFMEQRKYKEPTNRISTLHVASFLQMSTETFCRMIKKISIIK